MSEPKKPSDIFDKSVTFADLGLRDSVLKALDEVKFVHPTYIQSQLIMPVLEGRDVLGQAKTGTGKTAAFALPILSAFDPEVAGQALVLAPTRELAMQIEREIGILGKHTGVKTVSVVGGESMGKQRDKLERGAHVIVGTPGRVMDLHARGVLPYHNIKWAVLDEVDRMLDIGFRDDIRKILSGITQDHQTIFVSATISEEIERLGRRFMNDDAEKIKTVADSLTVNQVTQQYVPVEPWDKQRMLAHLLTHEEAALTVVFCRTKRTVDKLVVYLGKKDIEAFAIHGDLPQNKRNRIIEQLRAGKLEVLVASDLASRGLDVEGITHVVNYDLPDDPEVYVHRIGRTARAGRDGIAWAFVTSEQGQLLSDIEKLTNVHIEKLDYPDFEPRERPSDWKDEPRGGFPQYETKLKAEPRKNRMEADHSEKELADPNMFPGGIIPKNLGKKKSLGGRFKTRRGR